MSAAAARVERMARAGAPLVGLVAFLIWFGTAQADDRYWITLGIQAMWVGVSVIGINLLLGYTGLLSLGHFAFFLYGGFVGAIWAVEGLGVNPWLGFPIAFLVGMAMGALLALTCCHLHGFYLTVVTLAFALIASSLALLFESLFNGLAGRAVTEPLDTNFVFLRADNPNRPFVGLYWVGVVLLLACLMVTWNLMRSRWGRAFKAIRESELAADASGVPTYWYKVASFALSAGMVSLGGVLAAQTNLQVTMADGTAIVAQSFELVVDAVIGGLGTLAGPIVGAFAFTLGLGFDVGSESLGERLGEWETAFLAALVVVAMIAMPEGIVGRLNRLGARLHPPPAPDDGRRRWPSRRRAPADEARATTRRSRSRTRRARSAGSTRYAVSICASKPGRYTRSSARTARARPRWSTWSRASTGPTGAACCWAARTSPAGGRTGATGPGSLGRSRAARSGDA